MLRKSSLLFFIFCGCAAASAIPSSLLNRPLAFEPNRGQAGASVRFVARGNSWDYLLNGPGVSVLGASLGFLGANPEPHVSALDPLGERHNYFHGAVSQTDIPTYRRVRYSRLYAGIDCVFYGDQRGLEFDFEIAPRADPRKIRLRWRDAKRVRLDANGELVIETASGELRQRKPTVYQERDGRRALIAGGYVLAADGEIRFSLGRYDRSRQLIIDPVLFALDQNVIWVTAMAGDSAGNIYLTGVTSASILPTTKGAVQPAFGGGGCLASSIGPGGTSLIPCPDAFVIKLDSKGQLIYATYLGGDGGDSGSAIAADASGNVYVAGFTAGSSATTSNFPITPGAAFQKPTGYNGFVTKLNPAGSSLLYSTFIPGAPPVGIALDSQGNVYLASNSVIRDSPFPVTPGAFQTSPPDSDSAGVVAKLNTTGTALAYATYFGGTDGDVLGIAVDPAGNAYVTGYAISTDFQTTPGAFQTKLSPPDGTPYVAKIAASGASLVYSTFLGGSGAGSAIRVDAEGNAIVLGTTRSTDFPVTSGAFQPTRSSARWALFDQLNDSAFLAKLNPTGTALVYSTYLTGASALDLDAAGNAYVVGAATYGFPTTAGAFQTCSHGGQSDLFAAEFAPDGTLSGATYLGGSGRDAASAAVALGNGSVEFAGTTESTDFPGIVPGSFLSLVANILINDPNRPNDPCIAYTIQNGATFVEGPFAPGELITLRGAGIGPEKPAYAQIGTNGRVATELGGVEVLINGNPVPLLYAQSQQINAMVPWELANDLIDPSSYVQVRYNGASSNLAGNPLSEAAPGIFVADYVTLQAAVLNADGTPNSAKNPAKPGSVVAFYGTGGGVMNPPGVTGGVWPSKPLAHFTLPVSVQISGDDAEVRYAGSAPGMVSSVFQINVVVPDLIAAAARYPIVVTIGGVSSPPLAAFIAVK